MDISHDQAAAVMKLRWMKTQSARCLLACPTLIQGFPTNTKASAVECRDPLPALDVRLQVLERCRTHRLPPTKLNE
jgi:hypothetical protein